jgi:hypothetical protein
VNDASDTERSPALADATEQSFRRGTEGHMTNWDGRHIGGYRMSRDHAAITVCDDGPA